MCWCYPLQVQCAPIYIHSHIICEQNGMIDTYPSSAQRSRLKIFMGTTQPLGNLWCRKNVTSIYFLTLVASHLWKDLRVLVRRRWTWAWWSCPLSRADIAAACSPALMPAKAMAWLDLSELRLLISDMMLGNLLHSDGSEESTHILSTSDWQNSCE